MKITAVEKITEQRCMLHYQQSHTHSHTHTHTPPFPVRPTPHTTEVTALPSLSHTNMTTNNHRSTSPTDAPGASWEVKSRPPNLAREGEASPKYNSHLDPRTLSPVVQSEYVGGARPPTKATAISPYLPLTEINCARKKREIRVKYKQWWRFVVGARRTATSCPRVVLRENRRRQAEGVVLMLKWKWVGLHGHTLPTYLWISFWQATICSFMDCLSGKKRHTTGQRGGRRAGHGHCVLRYFRYLGLFDCACAWHRPSWPVGGFVKRADPPRPSAEHIGRPPLLYPAGLLPWTTPSPSWYINALWVVGILPSSPSPPPSLPLSAWQIETPSLFWYWWWGYCFSSSFLPLLITFPTFLYLHHLVPTWLCLILGLCTIQKYMWWYYNWDMFSFHRLQEGIIWIWRREII